MLISMPYQVFLSGSLLCPLHFCHSKMHAQAQVQTGVNFEPMPVGNTPHCEQLKVLIVYTVCMMVTFRLWSIVDIIETGTTENRYLASRFTKGSVACLARKRDALCASCSQTHLHDLHVCANSPIVSTNPEHASLWPRGNTYKNCLSEKYFSYKCLNCTIFTLWQYVKFSQGQSHTTLHDRASNYSGH